MGEPPHTETIDADFDIESLGINLARWNLKQLIEKTLSDACLSLALEMREKDLRRQAMMKGRPGWKKMRVLKVRGNR